jgi:hypothetical protein
MSRLRKKPPKHCPLFGEVKVISQEKLPTTAEILKYYLFTRNKLNAWLNGRRRIKNIAKLNVVEEVYKKIESIWNKTTIPIVSEVRAKTKIRQFYNEYWKTHKPQKGVLSL